jgi:hypothetical protein
MHNSSVPLSPHCGGFASVSSRREWLSSSANGFGLLALASLLNRDNLVYASDTGTSDGSSKPDIHSLAKRPPHFPAQAQSVIFVFCAGGPSQVDTFDPKPELQRRDGQLLPDSFRTDDVKLQFMGARDGKLMASPFEFQKYGESGLEFSRLFSRLGEQADSIALVRSCYHESFIHGTAINLMSTGSMLVGHPSVGSWITYGLGSETDSLPAFVVMSDGGYRGGSAMFHSGYLPALYQGTVLRPEGIPIQNLSRPGNLDQAQQRQLLDQLASWNRVHAQARPEDSRLEARIANYELAFRMQMAAPQLIDVSSETEATLNQYGINAGPTARFGRMCLLARRMVEQGVRFIELVNNDWDGHANCAANHQNNAAAIDQPLSALLADLKSRSLLDSTLVVWCGEFGRTPIMQGSQGRDHSPYGFSVWLAGGGIRGGQAIGATDEFGFRAVEQRVHVHDLHATILRLLGLDHERLNYLFEGRVRRLTDIGGQQEFSQRLLGMKH